MVATPTSKSAKIRRRLDHPVVDADGHVQEVAPLLLDYVREVGGGEMADSFFKAGVTAGSTGAKAGWFDMTEQERFETRTLAPTWWVTPTKNTLDRATAHLPRLLYERLDEMGIDFAIMYPTLGLNAATREDPELRRAGARAFNMYQADMFREFSDRITPAAAIPMHTPEEAIAELEHVVKVLGLKVVMMPGHIPRPNIALQRQYPDLRGAGLWMDTYGIDSLYDYDPVWEKCVELGVSPAEHSGTYGWGERQSVTNFQFNGTGHFGLAGEAMCKSLFMGGVTRRFPTLKFAFLEGGVHWACGLYSQMVSRWKKRNPRALKEYLDPVLLDRQAISELFQQYGDEKLKAKAQAMYDYLGQQQPLKEPLDDWAGAKIERAEEIRDLFVPHFYFGCEGDDPLAPWAFNEKANPFGARLRAMYGSDIGHWDVRDMAEALEEAWEPVERGLMTEKDFRDFVFTNAVTLYGGPNPDFFKGTVVETAAAKVLADTSEA